MLTVLHRLLTVLYVMLTVLHLTQTVLHLVLTVLHVVRTVLLVPYAWRQVSLKQHAGVIAQVSLVPQPYTLGERVTIGCEPLELSEPCTLEEERSRGRERGRHTVGP